MSLQVLEAKIKEVEAATDLEETAQTRLVELYRKALSHLETADANALAAEEFRRAVEAAPTEIHLIREEIEASKSGAPEDTLNADLITPLRQINQLLQIEKADVAAVDARHADLEKRLEEEARRPTLIRQRLTEAKQDHEAVAMQLKLPTP